jgi:phosphate uptake regulator
MFDQPHRILRWLYFAAACMAVGPVASGDEPVYEGRALTSWLQDLAIGRYPDMEKHRNATQAIRAMGSDALPMLTDRLKVGAIPADEDADSIQDLHTLSALEALGAEARPAIPDLIKLLAPAYDDARRSLSEPGARLGHRKSTAAANALRAMGDVSIPPLIEALKSEKTSLRFGAAVALGNYHRQAKDVVPALVKAIEDRDVDVRWMVCRSLGVLRAMPELVVPALTKRMHDDPKESVRWYATYALAKFDTKAIHKTPLESK